MKRTISCLLVSTLLFASPSLFAAAPAPLPPLDLKGVKVLVCAGYFDLLHIPAIVRLKAAGAEVRGGSLADLKWEDASQYHLIIAVDELPPVTPKDGVSPVQVLERFVKAGGGLLYYKNFTADAKVAAEYLAPFGGEIPLELISDPTHTYHCPTGFNLDYAWTADVTPGHPVTEGVSTVWYLAGKSFLFHTSPVKVSPEWQVLVTAAKEAKSMWVGGLNEEHLSKPGLYPSAPPLVAAREAGAGAIVMIGICPIEGFYGIGLPSYQDIMMEKGDGVRTSDTRRLYENSLRWLAAHALKSAELGKDALKPLEDGWTKPTLHDWSKDLTGNDLCTKPARGVIGVHSNLSDGKAAPAALIAQAQALGLQWLAFTEKLEDFSSAKWTQLRAACKAASTPQFAVLPGLDYADNSSTRYVVFGDFDWPPEKVFSPDQKRIVVAQWWFNISTPPLGPYNLAHSPLRYWDLSLYNFLPIRTTLAGKQVDENPEAFRHTQGVMDDPFPMAVEMCYDEAQLAAAAGRMCNYITQDQPGDLTQFYRNLMYFGSYRGFVSDGPLVTDWRAINDCRTSGAKWWEPGTEQYRVKLAVHSTAPITEIAIYDGPRLFRRFCPQQDKVSITFDLPHDQQRNLIAEITDANGKRAVTGGLFIRDFLNFRFMCGDRGNAICDGIQKDDDGAYLTGPTAPYQRKMSTYGSFPGYGERHFNILPPDFDGGMRSIAMNLPPSLNAKDLTPIPPGSTIENRMEVPVCSCDGILQDDHLVGYFPANVSAWENKVAPVDFKDVQYRFRTLDINPRPHDPGVMLLEGTVRFLRAMKVDSLMVFALFPSVRPGEADHYAIMTPTANISGLASSQPNNASGKMIPGSYVCVYPSLWGSSGAMALDDGYIASAYSKLPGNHVGITLDNMPREVKAGEEIAYRLVLLQGSVRALPNNAEWENFAVTMGFRGAPAYEVKDIKAGSVIGKKFLLELTPADSGFAGTVTYADLPIRLPVRVAEMNPNWTFAWFDLERKQWFPSAVDPLIRQGFFTLDTRLGAHRFFAGHPVVADNPEVRIAVTSDAKTVVNAGLNNPGNQPLKLTVRLNPALAVAPPQTVELAPGELKTVTFALPGK